MDTSFFFAIPLSELQKLIESSVIKAVSEAALIKHDGGEAEWLDLNELCKFLPDKPAKATVYSWVSKRTIPFHKKTKKLGFLKSEINQWLASGRRLTAQEITNSTCLPNQIKRGKS